MKKAGTFLLVFVMITFLSFSAKLNITLSKNSLDLNTSDSIIYKFYLPSGAHTNIKFVNIYGGEEIVFEENNARAKGWHEVMLHSDSLRQGNYSSGVYYAEIVAMQNEKPVIEFNSFQGPWGNAIAAENITLNKESGEISFSLSESCIAKTRIGYPNGSMVRTLSFGVPKQSGMHSEIWDGFEQTGTLSVKNMDGLKAKTLAYEIPQTSFVLLNAGNPLNFDAEPAYPKNWLKYALSSYAKRSWKEDYDIELDYTVKENDDETLTFTFGGQTKSFTNNFSPENEIYISIHGAQPVENPNVAIPGDYTIAFGEIPKGMNFVLVNLILPEGKVAVGVKQLLID